MDLHVKFTGLCLFAPNRKDLRMHVLMPSHHEGGAHVDPHEVTLNYRGGRPNLRMEEWFLDLSGAGGTGDKLVVQDSILEVGARATRKLDRQQWTKDARKSVVSHVTLPRASEIRPGRTVNWLVKIKKANGSVVSETPLALTHELTYVIRDVDALFFRTWQRHPLRPARGSVSEALPEPVPSGNVLTLEMKHLPVNQVHLNMGDEATHFQAFHNVFKVFPVQKAHVFLNEAPSKDTGGLLPGAEKESAKEEFGGSPFNCMLAQSESEDA